MCDCIKRVNAKLAEHNTCLAEVSMVNMKTGKCRQSIQVSTMKLSRLKKGKPKVMLPTYCPFCGRPHKGRTD